MGILEDVLGSVLGNQQRGGGMHGGGVKGGMSGGLGGMLGGGQGGMSPIAMALMALLTQQMSGRGGGGGLGDLLGGLTGGMGQIGSGQVQQTDQEERPPTGSGYAANSGLEGMLQRLEQAGQGQKAQSWVSHGDNHSIAPAELQQALGDDTVDRLSSQSGLPKDDLLSQLSEVLPGVIDKLTPHGRLPNRDETLNW